MLIFLRFFLTFTPLGLLGCCLLFQSMAWASKQYFLEEKKQQSVLPKGFVYAKNYLPLLVEDMRYAGLHNFVGRPIAGYQKNKCILTQQAAKALRNAQKDILIYGLNFKVYDCYRPQRASDDFKRWSLSAKDTKMKKEFYPTLNKKELFQHGYIASRSGHSRGSTIDIALIPWPSSKKTLKTSQHDQKNQKLYPCYAPWHQRFVDGSLDFGTAYDCLHPMAHTAYSKLTASQKQHRLLLKTVLEKHGFYNYNREWWHYTLKNEPFAQRYFDFVVQ